MTPIPASMVITETATTTMIIRPIERAAMRRTSRMPNTLTTSAMISTRREMYSRSDHWMPPGNTNAPSASGLTLYLPYAPPARSRSVSRSRCLRLVPVADTPHGHDAPGHSRVGLELLAQPPHMDGDGRGIAERPAPHLGQQLLAGE